MMKFVLNNNNLLCRALCRFSLNPLRYERREVNFLLCLYRPSRPSLSHSFDSAAEAVFIQQATGPGP